MNRGSDQMLLQATQISKHYPGVQALDRVNFDLEAGQIHALVGENGAGKSTLMKIFGGIVRPDSGVITLDGNPAQFSNPLQAQQAGIALIHQELNLMSDLTVAQNIFFGREPKRGPVIDDAAMVRQASKILQRIGLDVNPGMKLGTLTVAGRQMVEIAKALSMDARVLIMDEPTAALSAHEVEQLFAMTREFIAGGIGPITGVDSEEPPTPGHPGQRAVIYISHRLDEIQELCSHVSILRDGRNVSTDRTSELTRQEMIARMVGRAIDTSHRPQPAPSAGTGTAPDVRPGPDAIGFEVRNLNAGMVTDLSFTVNKGEIFGVAGLVGAGRTEAARAIVGADAKETGTVVVGGKEARIATVEDAVRAGIGYLSEDRKEYGLLLEQSITQNVALPSLGQWANVGGIIDDAEAAGIAQKAVDELGIATPSTAQAVRNLSGGNQQKVVIAKWVARNCDVLIFDEPTRGVDVGAKDDIYTLMEDLAAEGKTIIVISSEIEELLRVCHRIGVMCEGRLTGTLTNAEATSEKIMELATRFGAGHQAAGCETAAHEKEREQ
ncbi:ribose transport system ATP-binding protein [Trueperella bonasi]|uniref:Ribose transport system ATP-binding protein n=1 Tax=Trueperella bonasi TaxID=312286 RepID=A0ABT9NGB9_9ACTO|nr:sugar ABC transporter ATP-binding protein [Trueperella bonasi]MDP9806451.1 ribose transport system ATP-binding protein [Trueperella bonasi]